METVIGGCAAPTTTILTSRTMGITMAASTTGVSVSDSSSGAPPTIKIGWFAQAN